MPKPYAPEATQGNRGGWLECGHLNLSPSGTGEATSSSPFPKASFHGDEDIAAPFQTHTTVRGGDVPVAVPESSPR
jgi:hypothetical protein